MKKFLTEIFYPLNLFAVVFMIVIAGGSSAITCQIMQARQPAPLKIGYIDIDSVIIKAQKHIIEAHGKDEAAVKVAADQLGNAINSYIAEISQDTVLVSYKTMVGGGIDYTADFDSQIMAAIGAQEGK